MREGSEHQEQAEPRKVQRGFLVAMLIGCWVATSPLGLAQTDEDVPEPIASPYESSEDAARETIGEPAPIPEPVSPPEEPINEIGTPNASKNSDSESQELSPIIFGDTWAQWAMAFFSFVALLISGWAVWLLSETLDATRKTLKSAEDANTAAKDAVKVARDIGDRQLRAYLGVSNFALVVDGDTLFVDWKIVNHGQTPAYDVNMIIHFDFADSDSTDIIRASLADENNLFLNPGVGIQRHDKFPDSANIPVNLTKWFDGKFSRNLTFWGRVNYKDAFGESRILNFSVRTIKTPAGVIMPTTEKGNYGD